MLKCIITEGKKAIFGRGIILTAIGIFLINLINLWDMMRTFPTISALYFWVYRESLGGISMLIFLLCSLPYAVQFSVEKSSGSWKYFLIRERFSHYVISKIVVTTAASILASLAGYLLLFVFLSCKYMLYPEAFSDIEMIIDGGTFSQLALQKNPIFFFLNIIPEVMQLAFLSTLSLLTATWTENKYVVIASPIAVYYVWNYLVGTFKLPRIFSWTTKRVEGFQFFGNDTTDCLFTIGYYLIGIVIIGCIFHKRCKGGMENV